MKRLGYSPVQILRELHLVASSVLAALMVFFALTGFVAHHRGWFHGPLGDEPPSAAHGDPSEVYPLPENASDDPDTLARALAQSLGDAGVRDLKTTEGGLRFRTGDVWVDRTVEVDRAARSWTVTTRAQPLSETLVSIHRGRGRTERLLDVTVVVALVVAVTGAFLGLSGRPSRRRLAATLLVLSTLVVGVFVFGA